MLIISYSGEKNTKIEYTLDIMFHEFLGLDFKVKTNVGEFFEITRPDSDKKLSLDSSFFSKLKNDWLKSETLPVLPLATWKPSDDYINVNLIESTVPVLYGKPGLKRSNDHLHINVDIFGGVFFMLSRYEELIQKERDNHDRFPAFASIAYKANFLERPIVNEYLEILWACLSLLWPDLIRKKNQSQVFISCDVDQPYDCSIENIPRLIKTCAGDLVKRRSVQEMFKRINRYFFNKIGNYNFDSNYSFDWYMDVCENAGLKVAFYFIPTSKENNNGSYELTETRIIKLLKKIDDRGHEIGVHSSYQTYKDKDKIIKHKLLLDNTLEKAGIKQKIKGNRQHYLRWDTYITPEYLNDAGFEYDTTGGYADSAGFRFGTSKEFSMWGWKIQNKLKIKQRPLIIMECSVISNEYMGLGYTKEAEELMKKLKKISLLNGGNFSLLWHNSHLDKIEDKILFKNIVSV